MLFSIVFRSPATAALASLGLWLLLTLIWPALAQEVALAFVPADDRATLVTTTQILSRLSPNTLFAEVVLALLNPATQSALALAGAINVEQFMQLQRAVQGTLPLAESLTLAWPQIVGLVAATILLFVIGYVIFQRQEVRA
jgi:ABC-2 type transport system permease protein